MKVLNQLPHVIKIKLLKFDTLEVSTGLTKYIVKTVKIFEETFNFDLMAVGEHCHQLYLGISYIILTFTLMKEIFCTKPNIEHVRRCKMAFKYRITSIIEARTKTNNNYSTS